ncbi:MAG: lipocalin-like domain-containing protein [Gammaproteobacteria bacterium]
MTERRDRPKWWFLVAVALTTTWLLGGDQPTDRARPRDDDPTRYLRGPDAGFARALAPRTFDFPSDHGAHDAFRSEWWYFTGHLGTANGRRFGFQLTLFRFELAPTTITTTSAWRTPRVMLGHFALSDIAAARFHQAERLQRAHPAFAGVRAEPLEIHLDDWSIHRLPGTAERWTLAARGDGAAIALELEARSAIVLQGEAGLSTKSATPGNASYYYSIPRLAAHGEVSVDGTTLAVEGDTWLDREWSTSALDRAQRGWDWFALQLDDGANLMFYRLRDAAGGVDPHSAGSLQSADGGVERLAAGDVSIVETAWWRSPATGTRYPARWRLAVPRAGLVLELVPELADQEWRGRFRYWEGAVTVAGTRTGRGYVELTGYEAGP